MAENAFLDRFESGEIKPGAFDHKAHIRAAYGMLCRYEFIDACAKYASTIRGLAERAGAYDKYNTTITLAFMSLIAERIANSDAGDWNAFIEANPDLLERDALSSWYSDDRLHSPLARKQFVLPDKA